MRPKKMRPMSHGFLGILLPAFAAAVFFAVYVAAVSFSDIDPLYFGLIMLGLYAVCIILAVCFMRPKIDLETKESELHPLLGEIMLSAMTSVKLPAFIAEAEDDRILWYNRDAAAKLKTVKSLRGSLSTEVLDFITEPDENKTARAIADGRLYEVSVSDISVGSKLYELYSLRDITELEKAQGELAEHEVMVAYIMVDNIDELLQHEQEEYRYASSETEGILRNFATEANGILKEYQADRYIFFFEAKKFDDLVARRFDILDRIRDVRVGSGSTPITVSMGIANIGGSFAEKEKGAQAALEMALQRGGDQVVVKNRDGSHSIYGGRTKTIQKKGKVRARIVASEMLVHISNASNVIIMAHKRPDFDAFGASVGIARMCLFCGAKVNIVTDLSFSGIERCLDWVKDIPEYSDILTDGETALDLVGPDTLLIVADVNNINVFEEPRLVESCDNIMIIDHHRKTGEFLKELMLSYIEPSASATCELVCEMLEQVLPEELLLPREADLMFAGILLDTNQFRKNTGTRTFSAALYLKDRGADISAIQEFFKTSLDDYERENKFRSNIIIYRDITAIAIGEGIGDSDDNIPASRAADKLLELKGIKASFVLMQISDAVHISARSVGTINVQLILEQLKGGGHFDAAGAQIKGADMEKVVELLKNAIDKYFDESTVNERKKETQK